MNWSDRTWKSILPIYTAILEMPFIEELSNGNLPKEKFQFYMAQDSIYLEHFGRALALIGARAYEIKEVLTYLRFAENAILVENALHASFFKEFGLKERGVIQPACHHYVHFLKSTAALEPVEVAMAAVLPCFWIYKEVGDFIYKNQQQANNPYQRWIDTYGGEEFAIAVQSAIISCDKAAVQTTPEIRQRMTDVFTSSAHLEYNFWQSAYELKKWF